MKYAKVKSGNVERLFDNLPENYENTSGFKFLSNDELALRNVLPVVEVKPALGPFEDHGAPTVSVEPLQVVLTYPVIPADLTAVKQARRQEFRNGLKATIYATYDMDDIVAMLVLGVTPAAFKAKVQAAKTVYDNAISALNAATTIADALAVAPVWPA